MGIAIDPNNLKLYSCSIDITFYATDLANKWEENIIINIIVSGYTNVELDAPNKRIFLTNEAGELSVYSLGDIKSENLLISKDNKLKIKVFEEKPNINK